MKRFTYTETNLKKDWGKKYDLAYTGDNYDTRVWEIEKDILKKELISRKDKKLLDFAAGTGRVSGFLQKIGFRDITCMDSSNEMLKQAKAKIHRASFINLDITSDDSAKKLKSNYYETATAFRFFLNAEPELRRIAIKKISDSMKDDSILVFNIHGNKISLRFFPVIIINVLKFFLQARRRKNKEDVPYRNQLSIWQVKKLLKDTGVEIERVYSYSFMPKVLCRIFPRPIWLKIERYFVSRNILCGSHLMFVCRKAVKKNG